MSDTGKWLREMGAKRPMAVASEEVLVLGKWRAGHYPIQWRRYRDTLSRDFNGKLMNSEPIESWELFGFSVQQPLTKEDCERILESIGQ